MRVVRAELRAEVASFRHPFLVTGREPTFDKPPPSTVHGMCAAALGQWPDPATFYFGLHFTYKARARDLEHQHLAQALGANARTRVPTPDGEARATTETVVQPVWRDFLFDCRLTLYLPPDVGHAFRHPVHPIVLGRSQDLAEVLAVGEVDLRPAERVRLEHTLLPRWLRPCVRFGSTVLLSRYIGEPPEREPAFAQYISVHDPVFLGEGAEESRAFLEVAGVDLSCLLADPDHVDDDAFVRGVWMHRLRE